MGLSNAPRTFQMVMQRVLGDQLLGTCVLVYLDDLLIYSKNAADHLSHLKEVLQKLREAQLSLKEKKCHFLQQQVEFLGHIVSENTLVRDTSRVTPEGRWC